MKKHLLILLFSALILVTMLSFLFDINMLKLFYLHNLDLIVLTIIVSRIGEINILYVIFYATFVKDFVFSTQFTGTATIQYIVVYLMLTGIKANSERKGLYFWWINFCIISIIYTAIPVMLFYAKHKVIIIQESIKILFATVLWYPIIQRICIRKQKYLSRIK